MNWASQTPTSWFRELGVTWYHPSQSQQDAPMPPRTVLFARQAWGGGEGVVSPHSPFLISSYPRSLEATALAPSHFSLEESELIS